jgi:retinoid hydroxylase
MNKEESTDLIPLYREGESDAESQAALERDRAGFLVRAYREAGPIFRTQVDGQSEVILGGLQANEFIWRNSDLWSFPTIFPAFGEQMGADHLNVLEGDAHFEKRAILKPAFDQGPAMRYLPEYNAGFARELAAPAQPRFRDNITFWAEAITKLNTQTVARVDLDETTLKRMVRWEREMLGGILIGEARHEYYLRPEYVRLREEAMELMGRIVDDHIGHPERYTDHYSRVLQARLEHSGERPERHQLIDDLYYILFAGVENTSRLINAVTALCWFSPDWLGRVRAELDHWDGSDVMAVGQMTALKAVIMETQRYCPMTFLLRRHAVRDFEFGGFRVPAGTTIYHASVLGHFLDDVYPGAGRFDPGRFVEGGRFAPRANGFFGGGVHICLGRNYTQLQTPLAVAQTLKLYDPVYRDEKALRSVLSVAGQPLPHEVWLTLRPRLA